MWIKVRVKVFPLQGYRAVKVPDYKLYLASVCTERLKLLLERIAL